MPNSETKVRNAKRATPQKTEYQSAARRLDEEHSAPGTTPILDRLRAFTQTRGLVFGAYGEASADVHDLITTGARAQATRLWRLFGARSESEMYSYVQYLPRC